MFFLLLASMFSFGQELNRKVTDEKTGKEMLLGLCNKEALLKAPFNDWYEREYKTYSPDTKTMTQLKTFAGKWKVAVVFGTWCSDSRTQIPRFFKVIESSECTPLNIKMICVDTEKKCEEVDISGLNIEKVPTFIIYSGNKEIGRIIETPSVSIESDLLQILQKQ